MEKLRVAVLAPPWFAVPPTGYGGIEVVEATGLYFLPLGPGHPKARLRTLLSAAARSPHGREELIMNLRGIPHVALRARPL